MGLVMRGIGRMVNFMGMASLHGIMDHSMKGNMRVGRSKAMENSSIPIRKCMRANGCMESRKDKDPFSIRMDNF